MDKKLVLQLFTYASLACCGGIFSFSVLAKDVPNPPQGSAPLILETGMIIAGVPTSPYSDVMTLDLAGGRIFATPQASKSVAVLDLKDGHVLKMITGFSKLHGVIFDPSTRRLFVSDGTTGDVKVFNADDYSLIKSIPLKVGADSMTYDQQSHLIFVASGGEDAGMDHSLISAIDPVRMATVGDVSIAATGLEGIEVDPDKQVLYASLVNNSAIAVVDLKKMQQVASWKLPEGDHSPFALAIDSKSGRLYVTSRENLTTRERPVGKVFVLDTANGRSVASLQIGGWADGVFLDQKRQRIYVTSGVGWINTYRIDGHDRYTRLPDVETPLLSKHGLYSSQLDRLFVDTPTMALTEAQVLKFKPLP
jgi:DNA-binding beta-propeller fold protein YncE